MSNLDDLENYLDIFDWDVEHADGMNISTVFTDLRNALTAFVAVMREQQENAE